jgi:hypothetical protein
MGFDHERLPDCHAGLDFFPTGVEDAKNVMEIPS